LRFNFRVVVGLRGGDRGAIDGHHHRIGRVGLDERQDTQEALLPAKIRLEHCLRARAMCTGQQGERRIREVGANCS